MKYFYSFTILLLATGCFDILSDEKCEDGFLEASSIPGDYIGTFSYQVGPGPHSWDFGIESTVKIEDDSCFISLKLSSQFNNFSQLKFVLCESREIDCGEQFFYMANNPLFKETTCPDKEDACSNDGSGIFSIPWQDSVDYECEIDFWLEYSDPDSSVVVIYSGVKR